MCATSSLVVSALAGIGEGSGSNPGRNNRKTLYNNFSK